MNKLKGKYMRFLLFVSVLACSIILIPACASDGQSAANNIGYKGKTGDVFGYGNVDNAVDSLTKIADAEKREENGWTVISVKSRGEIWSFPPKSHKAYPSAVKRSVVQKDGKIFLDTEVSCGASKLACDNLVKDFIELNNRVQKSL